MHLASNVMRESAHETEEFSIVTPEELSRTSFLLRIVSGPDTGSCLSLDALGRPHTVLGQGEGSAIPLTDRHVSRKHVSLTAAATHLLLVDLGSRNGTKVNGVLVREARLYGGELVTIGSTTFGVETDRAVPANVQGTLPPPPASETRASESFAPSSDRNDFFSEILASQLPFTEARQRTVAEFERRYVEDCLQRHNGNVTHAARASGLAHRYFQLVRARSR